MAFRQGMIGTAIALGIAFTLGAPLTASAQGGGGSRPAAPAHRAAAVRTGPVHRAAAAAAAVAALHRLHSRGRRPRPSLGSS